MNGHTTPDCVFFYEFAAPHQLRGLLALAAARLGDPLAGVDERAFDLERQIIGSEHLVRADPRAGQWAVNAMFPRVFPAQHPYARPTGGTEESRRHFTLADARAYTARTFRPQRMTVVVSAPPGAISLAGIAALLPASLTASATRTPARRAGSRRRAGTGGTGGGGGHHRAADRRRAQAFAALGPRALAGLDAARRLRQPGPDGGGAGPLGRQRRSRRAVRQGGAADSPGGRLGSAGRIGERAVRARDRGRRGGRPSPGAGAGGARLQPVGARAGSATELRGTAPRVRNRAHPRRARAAGARGQAGAGHCAGRSSAAGGRRAVVGGGGEERHRRRVRLQATDARARARDVLRPDVAFERRRGDARRDSGGARGGGVRGKRAHPGRGGLDFEPARRAAAARHRRSRSRSWRPG